MAVDLTDGIRKLLLAGVGALSATSEKGKEIFEELVEKGELTVEQGKSLNSELKRNIKEKAENIKEKAENFKNDSEESVKKSENPVKDIIALSAGLTFEELDELKKKIDEFHGKLKATKDEREEQS